MAEELISITSHKPLDAVVKQLEDCLAQVGQAQITKKGVINLNPKAKYSGLLATVDNIDGTVRQRRENQYDVTLSYSTKATISCWIIGIFGGLCLIVPVAVFAVPFYTAKKAVGNDLRRALQSAQQELE